MLSKVKGIFLLDDHEKKFIHDVSSEYFENSGRNKLREKIVLIQIPSDYYYVSLFSILGNEIADQYQASLKGLWPYNVDMIASDRDRSFIKSIKRSLISWLQFKKWSRLYLSAGIHHNIRLQGVSIFVSIKNYLESAKISKKLKSKEDLMSLSLNGTDCGDLIYDTYLRYRVRPTVDLQDWYVRYLIWQALNAQHKIRNLINQQNIAAFISSYSSYIQHGIPVREFLQKNIAVYTSGNYQQTVKKLSLIDSRHTANYPDYAVIFQGLKNKTNLLKQAEMELDKRFSGGKDKGTLYMKNSAYSRSNKKEQIDFDGVLFLHDFFDSPHVYRWMLFHDFWEWLIFTLEVITKEKLNIAIKPHPNQISESSILLDEIKKKYPDSKWISQNINNKMLMNSGIKCGISVYGTVLHELAYHGVPAIAAGDHPHVSFDIAYTPNTKDEYRKLLISYRKLKVKKNVKQEVMKFYYMHNMHNQDAFESKAKLLNLRNLNANESGSLIEFLSRVK